ncbi:SPASM domain-containing protein [Carboxylicivirga sp. A043]|uniref:radical SAM/SPASM domain-containing protein n=1 Tax=Carboxylicivirga litoralis TaxID=2816963 RepID=UPI0021CAEEE6|nr:radical SAM/SPASM domain-containing protein [Carboxylicivirga sp. A043]MCU4155913.1 SPASM domain-containing protein [Carboxylicivirga sp. A043]
MQLRAFFLETWAIIRVMNYCRLSNALKLIYSYLQSYLKQHVGLHGKPMAFSIEPTSSCNLKCPECPTGANLLKRPRGLMDIRHYRQLLQQLSPELFYLNLYVQGEPFMHPQFPEMVSLASQHNLYISTSTNGHFMSPEIANALVRGGLSRIIFSVDGTSQESYGLYRVGGNFNKVRQSIIDVVRAKARARSAYPIIVMQFLVFRHNERELPQIKKLARRLKVDKLEIKTAQLNDFGSMRPPLNARFSRYADSLGQQLKTKSNNRCWRQWHSATVTWDGRLAPCCYDKDAEYAFGNSHDNSLQEIWQGDKSILFKQQIFRDRSQITICRNCPEGKKLF